MKKYLLTLQLCALVLLSGCAAGNFEDLLNSVVNAPAKSPTTPSVATTNNAPAKTETLPPISPRVYLFPAWGETSPGSTSKCMQYASAYRMAILDSVLSNEKVQSNRKEARFDKSSYLYFAGLLGYRGRFSPTEKDSLVSTVKDMVDRDFYAMSDAISKVDYLLFVGDRSGSFYSTNSNIHLPHAYGYEWESNKFSVDAYSSFKKEGFITSEFRAEFKMSSQAWENAGFDKGENIYIYPAILLVHKKSRLAVYGEVREYPSGRTLLSFENQTGDKNLDKKTIADAIKIGHQLPNITFNHVKQNTCDGINPERLSPN